MFLTHLSRKLGFFLRRPWITQFRIQGHTYGGHYDAMSDQRLTWFRETFPDAREILELGSLEGGHTFALAQQADRVVAIEGRSESIRRAEFVRRQFNARNVQFIEADLEQHDLTIHGQFDVVFCLGLLYHLPKPWELLHRIAAVSNGTFIWTHYAAETTADITEGGYPGAWYNEFGRHEPLSGLSARSFWPTRAGLIAMLADAGLSRVRVFEDDTTHIHGPAITLAAWK